MLAENFAFAFTFKFGKVAINFTERSQLLDQRLRRLPICVETD